MSFGGAFFILPGERGVVAKEGLWMVRLGYMLYQRRLYIVDVTAPWLSAKIWATLDGEARSSHTPERQRSRHAVFKMACSTFTPVRLIKRLMTVNKLESDGRIM
jgi:hypothetical protein